MKNKRKNDEQILLDIVNNEFPVFVSFILRGLDYLTEYPSALGITFTAGLLISILHIELMPVVVSIGAGFLTASILGRFLAKVLIHLMGWEIEEW